MTNATPTILIIVDKEKMSFDVRAELDPKGKDSLGYYVVSARKQVKKMDSGKNVHFRHRMLTHLATRAEHLEQIEIPCVPGTTLDEARKVMCKIHREAYIAMGWTRM